MGPGEVQTLYVKLHRPASGGVPDWGGFDWDTPLDNEARLGNEPSRWGSRLTWFFGLVLIAVTVAFSVVVVGSPAPVERGDGDDTFGAMPMHHLSKDIIRRSDTLAYDVTEIDWLTLRSDLEILVSDCRCGPILVRLGWHDAGTFNATDGTGGSRAAQRFADGESTDPANAGLVVARKLLQPFKERYRQVGYADLWSLAAVVAIEGMGGPRVNWRAGRRDARSATDSVPHGRLPDGLLGASHLRAVFGRMGFEDHEIVALSGAHTVGRCHADRSGFVGAWTQRPLNWDTEYFQLLLQCTWEEANAPGTGMAQMSCPAHPDLMMLHTDVALVTDPAFRPHVERYAQSKEAFFKDFAVAYQKMQELGHEGLVKPRHF